MSTEPELLSQHPAKTLHSRPPLHHRHHHCSSPSLCCHQIPAGKNLYHHNHVHHHYYLDSQTRPSDNNHAVYRFVGNHAHQQQSSCRGSLYASELPRQPSSYHNQVGSHPLYHNQVGSHVESHGGSNFHSDSLHYDANRRKVWMCNCAAATRALAENNNRPTETSALKDQIKIGKRPKRLTKTFKKRSLDQIRMKSTLKANQLPNQQLNHQSECEECCSCDLQYRPYDHEVQRSWTDNNSRCHIPDCCCCSNVHSLKCQCNCCNQRQHVSECQFCSLDKISQLRGASNSSGNVTKPRIPQCECIEGQRAAHNNSNAVNPSLIPKHQQMVQLSGNAETSGIPRDQADTAGAELDKPSYVQPIQQHVNSHLQQPTPQQKEETKVPSIHELLDSYLNSDNVNRDGSTASNTNDVSGATFNSAMPPCRAEASDLSGCSNRDDAGSSTCKHFSSTTATDPLSSSFEATQLFASKQHLYSSDDGWDGKVVNEHDNHHLSVIPSTKPHQTLCLNIDKVASCPNPPCVDSLSNQRYNSSKNSDDDNDAVSDEPKELVDKLKQAGQLILESVLNCVNPPDLPDSTITAQTADRFAKMMIEMTAGYRLKPKDVIEGAIFYTHHGYSSIPSSLSSWHDLLSSVSDVVIRNLPVSSLCEHHLLPFHGTCTIAYLPQSQILGLSKFSRIVDVFAYRLQLQERLTEQIVEFLHQSLNPYATGITITAIHGCMALRGVRTTSSSTTTQAFRFHPLLPPELKDRLRLRLLTSLQQQ